MKPTSRRGSRLNKGGRQAVWDRLRRGPASRKELIAASGMTERALNSFIGILTIHGYTSENEKLRLEKDTGPDCPSVSTNQRALYDWNLNPQMTPSELRAAWITSGRSLRQFGFLIGMSDGQSTRLKQMMDGQRPVTQHVQAAVEAWQRRSMIPPAKE